MFLCAYACVYFQKLQLNVMPRRKTASTIYEYILLMQPQ